ncbi:uncharacterized protein MELLADRAFT_114611, partial [Melampsora larici-populina 98AG31]
MLQMFIGVELTISVLYQPFISVQKVTESSSIGSNTPLKPIRNMGRADFTCGPCDLIFADKTKTDEHHRLVHQQNVKVKTIHGEEIQIPRAADGFFHCPVTGCQHFVKNPRNLATHVKRCTGPAPTAPQRPIPNFDGQQVRVVPYGSDIKEMHTHHMNDDPTRDVDKEVMMAELQEYAPLIAAGPFPPHHVEGQKAKPIEGLLLYNGFTCKFCNKSWKNMKSVINHFITNHKEAVNILLEKLTACATEEAELGPDSILDKDMANWVYVTGIYTYTQGLLRNGKTCEELVVAGAGNENVESMVAYIATWINKTMKRLHQTGQLLKRMCMAETSPNLITPIVLFQRIGRQQRAHALARKGLSLQVCADLATFMWFLIEQAEEPLDPNMEIHDVTKARILGLRDVVLHLTTPDTDPSQLDYLPAEDDHVSSHVSGILCCLFQTYCGGWAQQYQLPPMAFIALSVFKEDGSYDSPNLITHLIAAMQYGTRLAFAEQYLDEPRPRFDPAADPTNPVEDNMQKFEFLRKGGPGAFKYVRQLMHLVSTVILSEALPDTTFWADHQHETLEVDNKLVTVSGIRDCIHLQQKRAQADLSTLLKGCKMPLFDTSLYHDVATCRQPGTNFLNHSELEHGKYGLHLLKEWTRKNDVHGLLAEGWQSKVDSGVTVYDKSIWKASAVWEWLELYNNLQERLYFLYHVASGFLRPTAIFFLKALGRPERAREMATKVWVSALKGPMDSTEFSAILKRHFTEGGVAPLGIQSWRHVSVAIVDAHIKLHRSTLLEGEDDIIDCQRGHSTFTANSAYGGTGGYH